MISSDEATVSERLAPYSFRVSEGLHHMSNTRTLEITGQCRTADELAFTDLLHLNANGGLQRSWPLSLWFNIKADCKMVLSHDFVTLHSRMSFHRGRPFSSVYCFLTNVYIGSCNEIGQFINGV